MTEIEDFLDFNDKIKYEFARCEGCFGPLLGHIEAKCTGKEGVRYGSEAVKSFEIWIKRVKMIELRRKKRDEIRLGWLAEAVRVAVETIEKKSRPEEKTTQLVKLRFPSLWSGKEFDRWRVEVENWFDNNKSTEEEKYIDLLESLKKNEAVKEFVVKP